MSGTSVDGIDAVLTEIRDRSLSVVHTHSKNYPEDLQRSLRALASGQEDSVHRVALADTAVGRCFAEACLELLSAASIATNRVTAIGSHGQTIRHNPAADPASRYTVQIGDPSAIAEITGIPTVADFRRQDLNAGGQGAPLVPAFHQYCFSSSDYRAILNLGGIANVTLLRGNEVISGFDSGPGNTLLDAWVRRELGLDFDRNGAWSAEHHHDEPLLERLLAAPYFDTSGPRSTGPELFNLDWLKTHLHGGEPNGVVQATLAELTAESVFRSLNSKYGLPTAVFVCGGGARNTDLMRRLSAKLEPHGTRLGTTDELGLAAEWVEAAAFAWLAHQRLANRPANVPVVTGASGSRTLGAIYPAPLSKF